MTSEAFVRALAECAPCRKVLADIGLTPDGAERARRAYQCRKRDGAPAIKAANELLDLLHRWDVGHITIGAIRFLGAPRLRARGWQVGTVDFHPLIIGNDPSEILVEETAADQRLLWKVAASPAHFLAAAAVTAAYRAALVSRQVPRHDLHTAREIACRCAILAGGDSYADFYYDIMGGYKSTR